MISRRRFLQWVVGLGAAGMATAAYGFGIEPMSGPRITRYRLRPKRWSPGFNLSIAVLADIHACHPWMDPARIAGIVTATNALGADLIVLLGDYSTGHHFVTARVHAHEWSAVLGALRAPLGVHAILGNHDWWEDESVQQAFRGPPYAKAALEKAGIRVYENEAARLSKDSLPFWLAGLGDQLAFWPMRRVLGGRRMGVDDLPGTLAQITDDAPVILLAHEPDIIVDVPDRVSLTLSGHTHGGQVRLLGWSPVVPSRYGNRFAYGHTRKPSDLVVSGGLGCSIVPFRFGMPPEIVLVELSGTADVAQSPRAYPAQSGGDLRRKP
jgi:predicted MPP superfamily phosphohydrolase